MDFGDCPSRGDDPFTWAVEADRFGCSFFRRKISTEKDAKLPGFFGTKQFEDWVGVFVIFYHDEKNKVFFVTYIYIYKRWLFLAKEIEQNASTVFW